MNRANVAAPRLPTLRATLVFGVLLTLFALLIVRSLYLQRVENGFLQEQGSSRYSRDLDVPAHRGRIVDRLGPCGLSRRCMRPSCDNSCPEPGHPTNRIRAKPAHDDNASRTAQYSLAQSPGYRTAREARRDEAGRLPE